MLSSKAALVVVFLLIGTSYTEASQNQDEIIGSKGWILNLMKNRRSEPSTTVQKNKELQKASFDDYSVDDIMSNIKDIFRSNDTKKPRATIYYGSQDIQIGNVYSQNEGGETVYGPQDIQNGNIYPENPDGTNVYGSILIQTDNVYHGEGDNIQYGSSVTQVNNVYPKNSGKKDIYAPVVIQNGNIYPENPGKNIMFGAIVNQINNTYPKSVEANKDALKPVIHQSGNVHPPTFGTNSVVGAVVNNTGNRFHPFQGHDKIPDRHMSINKVKRRHEEINKIIDEHLQTDQPTSRRCAYSKVDLKQLDRIESSYLKVETTVAQIKALQEINRYRKIICDSIGNQCSNHAKLQKWLARSRRIVMNSTTQSRERLASLQAC